MTKEKNGAIVITNRQASRDYALFEVFEAGIELKGTEVKSLRQRKANLKDSFARPENGELYLYNFHISPYEFGNIHNVDPLRRRRLLLHKSEIRKLLGKVSQKGFTLIPLKVYFKKGFAKVELAVARGKRQYDKRRELREKEAQREIDRSLRRKR